MPPFRHLLLVGTSALICATAPVVACAQDLDSITRRDTPLVLQDRGSFFVGGQSVEQAPEQLSSFVDTALPVGGHITVNQMYVEYMVPADVTGTPVVMLHGSTLSGKTYDTTPDGRMGWYEYFVRQGHSVYVPDQVGRARSGTHLPTYNTARHGTSDATDLPNMWRFSDEVGWTNFRLGPTAGARYDDGKFPYEAAAEFSAQAVPDFSPSLPSPDPNIAAMAQLGNRLNGAVLMGHSQTGNLPLRAALVDPGAATGLILIEPGGCLTQQLSDEDIAVLADLPTLVVFGDHLDQETGLPGFSWQPAYADCKAFIDRVNQAGGTANMLYPPDLGIHGNSHMIMQDRNSLEIADLILEWTSANVAN